MPGAPRARRMPAQTGAMARAGVTGVESGQQVGGLAPRGASRIQTEVAGRTCDSPARTLPAASAEGPSRTRRFRRESPGSAEDHSQRHDAPGQSRARRRRPPPPRGQAT